MSLVICGFEAATAGATALRAVALEAVAAMPCPATALRASIADAPGTDAEEEDPDPEEEEEDDRDDSGLPADSVLNCIPCFDGRTLLLARVCCFPGERGLDPACEGVG